jgi:hypothetical protein
MQAYHFLRSNMRAGAGEEAPWRVGERREITGPVVLCERGYHSAPSWYDALMYAPGPVACIVEIDGDVLRDNEKQVSQIRTLLAAVHAERELRLFACDCAERALKREGRARREPDARSWAAIDIARRFATGNATAEELEAASSAASDAVSWAGRAAACAGRAAACAATWPGAMAAARAAADAAARAVPWGGGHAEINWQRKRLARYLNAAFVKVAP